MDFEFSPEDQEFREQVCDFLDKEMTPEVTAEIESNMELGEPGPHARALVRKLGAKGWLAPSWPKEYGGSNFSHLRSFIIAEESTYRGAGGMSIGTHMAGPVIQMFGSEELKGEYLPRIARGEIGFALGYTEPQAGSDLTSLELRAESDGDDYILNGQKVFSTGAHLAEYHWLAVRTDRNVAKKHKGISLLIVDLKSPGITIRPLWCMSGERTNEVFYDDVRVPKKNRIGEENRGWYCIAKALDLERSNPVSGLKRFYEQVIDYAKQNQRNGKVLSKDPLIRQKLAEIKIRIEIAYLFGLRVAWMQDRGQSPNYEASMLRLSVTELWQHLANVATEIMGLYGQLWEESKGAHLGGRAARFYLSHVARTIAGGTSEIQRNIIAIRGLGLPVG